MEFYKKLCFWSRQLNPWHPLTQACRGVNDVHDELYTVSIELCNGHELSISFWNQFGLPCMMPHQLNCSDVTGSVDNIKRSLPGTYIDYITYDQMYCTRSHSLAWYIGFHVTMWSTEYLIIPCHKEDTLMFTYQKTKYHPKVPDMPSCKPINNKEENEYV